MTLKLGYDLRDTDVFGRAGIAGLGIVLQYVNQNGLIIPYRIGEFTLELELTEETFLRLMAMVYQAIPNLDPKTGQQKASKTGKLKCNYSSAVAAHLDPSEGLWANNWSSVTSSVFCGNFGVNVFTPTAPNQKKFWRQLTKNATVAVTKAFNLDFEKLGYDGSKRGLPAKDLFALNFWFLSSIFYVLNEVQYKKSAYRWVKGDSVIAVPDVCDLSRYLRDFGEYARTRSSAAHPYFKNLPQAALIAVPEESAFEYMSQFIGRNSVDLELSVAGLMVYRLQTRASIRGVSYVVPHLATTRNYQVLRSIGAPQLRAFALRNILAGRAPLAGCESLLSASKLGYFDAACFNCDWSKLMVNDQAHMQVFELVRSACIHWVQQREGTTEMTRQEWVKVHKLGETLFVQLRGRRTQKGVVDFFYSNLWRGRVPDGFNIDDFLSDWRDAKGKLLSSLLMVRSGTRIQQPTTPNTSIPDNDAADLQEEVA